MVDNGKGALWKNEKKSKEAHPDYTGSFALTRDLLEEFRKALGSQAELKVQLAAWIKEGRRGKFLSVSVSKPFERDGQRRSAPPREDDDEAPF